MKSIDKTDLQVYVGSFFGTFDKEQTNIKFYKLGNLSEQSIIEYSEDKGFKLLEFSHETKPDFSKYGYKQGYVWVYNPNQANNSFHDVDYIRKWRYTHELAHALTYEQVLKEFNISKVVRGSGRLSEKEAVISLTWELYTLRKQWDIIEELGGVSIINYNRKRELLTLLYDLTYRCISGEFANPDLEGFQADILLLQDNNYIADLVERLPNIISEIYSGWDKLNER